jgi:hypothetical protein
LKKPAIIGILLAVAILGAIVYTTIGNQDFRVEVCMEYKGRSSCRIASARVKETAERSARENACAQISSGSFDSLHCENGEPKSVKWLKAK